MEGWQNEPSRICEHNDFNTTDGLAENSEENATKSNIHFGTQNSDGDGIKKTSIKFGECSSYQRNKERQQTEQFSDRGQSESLENTQANRCGNGTIEKGEPILEVLDFDVPTEWLRYFEYTGENLGCECKGVKKIGSGKEGGYNYKGNLYDVDGFVPNNSPEANSNYGQETIEDWTCNEDCPIRIMDEQSGISKTGDIKPYEQKNTNSYSGSMPILRNANFKGDKGGASRFFYCAKASKSERNKGLIGFEEKEKPDNYIMPKLTCSICGSKRVDSTNKLVCNCGGETHYENQNSKESKNNLAGNNKNFHPTVKPVALMQYLVRMITPPNGIVLDPFNGSGTTGIACKLEGFEYVGMELDAEYCKIAQARIDNFVPSDLDYSNETQEEEDNQDKSKGIDNQMSLF